MKNLDQSLPKQSNHLLTIWRLMKSNFLWWSVLFACIFRCVFLMKDNFIRFSRDYFSLEKIEFDGNSHIPEILLLKASKLRYKDSVLLADVYDIKDKLEKISWVKSAIVRRKLPRKISIRIAERVPIAILKSQRKLYLVDSEGVVLDNDGFGNFSHLPIVAGEGAEKEVSHFLQCIDKFPKIKRQLVFAIRVGQRRWNIKINKGVTIKLPEQGLTQAFGILDEISDSNGCFYENIASLDLRTPDRIIIGKKDQMNNAQLQ